MNKKIYMDYAGTTYLKKQVFEEMIPYFKEEFYNPSSMCNEASKVKMAIDESRKIIANFIGAKREEIFFTSGGTESDNFAIKGIALKNKNKGMHIITSKIEHHAVLNTCEDLVKNGFEVTYIPVDKKGIIDLNALKSSIQKDTILVSVMMANNEIGTIQPIREIGRICRKKGILFHTDAVQALGHIKIDVEDMNIDLLTMSAHKIYGPKGIGALYIRKGTKIENIIYGGPQERGKRGGTENPPAIVGFGKAVSLLKEKRMEKDINKIKRLRNRLLEGLKEIPKIKLNGVESENRLDNNINISFENVDGELLLMMLFSKGICVSSGSVCSAGSSNPSHVLLALGSDKKLAKATVRFTLGDRNTEEEIDYVIKSVWEIVNILRK
ncbi:IscS subfamily cysteine desulfurase [Clostridium oceanicum]|uniref:cysteine desulfurase n=1 Tax=Clostridium oceanicum TaxID=1543 RepID=A0ABN1JFC8_9CLOT